MFSLRDLNTLNTLSDVKVIMAVYDCKLEKSPIMHLSTAPFHFLETLSHLPLKTAKQRIMGK